MFLCNNSLGIRYVIWIIFLFVSFFFVSYFLFHALPMCFFSCEAYILFKFSFYFEIRDKRA